MGFQALQRWVFSILFRDDWWTHYCWCKRTLDVPPTFPLHSWFVPSFTLSISGGVAVTDCRQLAVDGAELNRCPAAVAVNQLQLKHAEVGWGAGFRGTCWRFRGCTPFTFTFHRLVASGLMPLDVWPGRRARTEDKLMVHWRHVQLATPTWPCYTTLAQQETHPAPLLSVSDCLDFRNSSS